MYTVYWRDFYLFFYSFVVVGWPWIETGENSPIPEWIWIHVASFHCIPSRVVCKCKSINKWISLWNEIGNNLTLKYCCGYLLGPKWKSCSTEAKPQTCGESNWTSGYHICEKCCWKWPCRLWWFMRRWVCVFDLYFSFFYDSRVIYVHPNV